MLSVKQEGEVVGKEREEGEREKEEDTHQSSWSHKMVISPRTFPDSAAVLRAPFLATSSLSLHISGAPIPRLLGS